MAFLDDACAAVRRWLSLLGITDRVKVEVGKLEPHVCASTWTNPDYLEALIVFNDPAVSGPYDLEEVAAHEVFHIPMAGFQTKSGTRERSEEERVVERFSRAFVALWRGTPFANRVALAPTLRAIIGESRKARHRLAGGADMTTPAKPRYAVGDSVAVSGQPHMSGQADGIVRIAAVTDVYGVEFAGMSGVHKWYVGDELKSYGDGRERMHIPQDVMDLIMQAGAAAEREDVPDDVKELLRKLVATSMTGETPPSGEGGDAAPAQAETTPGPDEDAPPPAMRASLSEKARKALEAADRDAEQIAELAKKRVGLETAATRNALFDSAPDVFGGGKAKRREIYAAAPIDEIERFIKSQREERPSTNPDDYKARAGHDPHREPPTGAAKKTLPKNDGGLVVRGGGN